MLVFVISLLAVFGFVFAFIFLGIAPMLRDAINETHTGISAIFDDNLTEEEKETAVKSAGLALLKKSFEILWRIALSLVAAAAPVYLSDKLGYVPAETVTQLMLRWEFIIGTTATLGGIGWIISKYQKKYKPQSAYSVPDKIIHKLAFSSTSIQLTAAEIEDSLFANLIGKIEDQPPIFITSLPRTGTTILLTVLNEIPNTASHIYRDMPFIMSPLLWSRINRMSGKRSEMKERAHGDGIKIGYDSPEAFEEIIWRTFWPQKYHKKSIELWCIEDILPEATEYFIKHFRKIVALRTNGTGCYISKNNNNIARLEILPEMFPNSHIVVPLREPAEQATSLFRQHKNFLKQQSADPFIECYMRDIGHLEFGKLHTPFAFASFDRMASSPEKTDYWLDYWIAAYEMVLERAGRLHIVSLEKLGKHPKIVLDRLCERLNLDPSEVNLSKNIRPIENKAESGLFEARKLAIATDIYHNLLKYQV
ncbi:MAG: sulfotransferase [Candidatus Thiodiazotropha endolucinida]